MKMFRAGDPVPMRFRRETLGPDWQKREKSCGEQKEVDMLGLTAWRQATAEQMEEAAMQLEANSHK